MHTFDAHRVRQLRIVALAATVTGLRDTTQHTNCNQFAERQVKVTNLSSTAIVSGQADFALRTLRAFKAIGTSRAILAALAFPAGPSFLTVTTCTSRRALSANAWQADRSTVAYDAGIAFRSGLANLSFAAGGSVAAIASFRRRLANIASVTWQRPAVVAFETRQTSKSALSQ